MSDAREQTALQRQRAGYIVPAAPGSPTSDAGMHRACAAIGAAGPSPKGNFGRPKRSVVGILGAVLMLISVVATAQTANAQNTSRAFAIPSSDLVFHGELTLPSGKEVQFSSREGAFLLVDPTPEDPEGRLGIILTLDRTGEFARTDKAIVAHPWRVTPNPAGGETMERMNVVGAPYDDEVVVESDLGVFKLTVRADELKDFSDGMLVTRLWEAIREDAKAYEGLYDELYSLYGPTSQACQICDGTLVCATDVQGCEGNGGGGNSY